MTKPALRDAARRLEFTLELDAADEFAFDATRADALLTIHARSGQETPSTLPSAEILIMDRSLSMAAQGKVGEAKRAACAAIDAVRDGTRLGIIAGHHEAMVLYPADGRLAQVDGAVRAAAKRAVLGLVPQGGTAIGRWLTRAAQLFEAADSGAVRHAALYTDGRNEHETPDELGRALEACADRFVCDVRGLGNDWNYAEVLRIAEALHGDAKAVVSIADLTGDFTQLMEQSRRLAVPRVYLGLRLNNRFQVGLVRQTRPVEAELTHRQLIDGEIHIPLGAWAPETRQYQLSLLFDPGAVPVGEELRAARIRLLTEAADGTRIPCTDPAPMIVRRSDLAAPLPPIPEALTRAEVAHELGMAMRACADAQLAGNFAEADRELRLALRLARQLGDAARVRLLEGIASVDGSGVARVRRDVARGRLQQLGVESTRTGAIPVDVLGPVDTPAGESQITRVCPECGEVTHGTVVNSCEGCGHLFGGGVA